MGPLLHGYAPGWWGGVEKVAPALLWGEATRHFGLHAVDELLDNLECLP
jgi:hypothetical protein